MVQVSAITAFTAEQRKLCLEPDESDKVVRKDRGSDGGNVMLPALVEAAKEPECTLEVRDRPLDSGAETLRQPEEHGMLTFGLLLGAPSLLPNRNQLHVLLECSKSDHARKIPLVGSQNFRRAAEEASMTRDHTREQVRLLSRSSCEDPVVRDEVAFDLLDLDHMAVLDPLSRLAADQKLRVGLEDTEDLLLTGDDLPVEDSSPGLVQNSFGQPGEVSKVLNDRLYHRVLQDTEASCMQAESQPGRNLRCPGKSPFHPLHELFVGRPELLLRYLLFPLRCAADLIREPLRPTVLEASGSYRIGIDIPGPSDEPAEDSRTVRHEARVRWVVDIGLHGGGIQADLLAFDETPADRIPSQETVDRPPGLRPDCIFHVAQMRGMEHGPHTDPREDAENAPIVDAEAGLSKWPTLNGLDEDHPEDLVCRVSEPLASSPAVDRFDRSVDVPVHGVEDPRVLIEHSGQGLVAVVVSLGLPVDNWGPNDELILPIDLRSQVHCFPPCAWIVANITVAQGGISFSPCSANSTGNPWFLGISQSARGSTQQKLVKLV